MEKMTMTATDIRRIAGVGTPQERKMREACEEFLVKENGEMKPWRETLEGRLIPKNKIPIKLFERVFPNLK